MKKTRAACLLLWLLLLWGGCDDGLLTVTLQVSDKSGLALAALSVRPVVRRVAGTAEWPAQTVYQSLDRLVVRVKIETAGALLLEVTGMDAGKCAVARGTAPLLAVAPGADAQTTQVELRALPAAEQGCQVQVQLAQSGRSTGRVSAAAQGWTCAGAPSCTLGAVFGQQVTLTAEPAEGSYFAGWSGECHGAGACTVTSGQLPIAVSAGFLPTAVCDGAAGAPRWCWENPLPQGGAMTRVFALAANNVWAIGESNVILHWNGAFWAQVQSGPIRGPTGEDIVTTLNGLWAASDKDIWVVGGYGVVLHGDGTSFTQIKSGTTRNLAAVHGMGTKVWIVGEAGTLLHSSAGGALEARSAVTQQTLTAVFARSEREALAVGLAGTIIRDDGRASSVVYNCVKDDLYAVWANAQGVFLAGASEAFSPVGVVLFRAALPTRMGECWSRLEFPQAVSTLWGNGPDELWAAGVDHSLLRYDGASWRVMVAPQAKQGIYTSASGTSADDIWLVGPAGRLDHWNGAFVTPQVRGVAGEATLLTTWAASLDDVWAAGSQAGLQGVLLHRDRGVWDRVPLGVLAAPLFLGVWASASNDVWLVGEGGATLRYDGRRWGELPQSPRYLGINKYALTSVWGSARDDVWPGGRGGSLWHWDGKDLTLDLLGDDGTVFALAGSSARDVWAVGGQSYEDGSPSTGTIAHYDGAAWKVLSLSQKGQLRSVASTGPGKMIAVGEGGLVVRVADGAVRDAPKPTVPATTVNLHSVWVSPAGEVFASGAAPPAGGLIYHLVGDQWELIYASSVVPLSLHGSGSDVFAVGTFGTILHRRDH